LNPRDGVTTLKLELDIKYDPAFDGAIRLDSANYNYALPGSFVCGDVLQLWRVAAGSLKRT
jgi:hypothetical protein